MSTNKTTSKKATPAKTVKAAAKEKPNGKTSPATSKPVEAEKVEAATVEAEKVEAEEIEVEKVETEKVEAEKIKAEKVDTEQIEKSATNNAMKLTSSAAERYQIACAEVSTTNRAFLDALKEKAQLIGTEVKGESVGIRNFSPEVAEINEQVKKAKAMVNDLLNRRRELMTVSPEVEVINLKITGLRKARNLARAEKKLAASELGL